MGTYWDTSPPHPCERLARMEGTSNFLGLLSGQEAGPDTTEDAAALAMCRTAGGVPEALEARWAGTQRDKVALCHMVYDTLPKVADKDRTWTKAAILDGFYLFSGERGRVRDHRERAKTFKVRHDDYHTVRKYAERLLTNLANDSERPWIQARFTGG